MEPRPQRPRTQPQGSNRTASVDQTFESFEAQPYIAPPRADYDYSPLDLAPPGQRRRRQFIAAGIGALLVLMLVSVVVLAYLLIADDGDNSDPDSDIAALATENAATREALDAQSTSIAETQEPEDSESEEQPTTESEQAEPTEDTTENETEGTTDDSADGETEPEDTPEDETTETGTGPSITELNEMQPGVELMPPGIDSVEPTSLDFEGVVTALGGSRPAEQNLQEWGWSGNSGRLWGPSDPNAIDPGLTTTLSISIHGFKDSASASEALTFFSDVLIDGAGFTEEEAPELGETARMASLTDDSGVSIVLYVQIDNVLFIFRGYAPTGGDPTADVLALAEQTIPIGG